MTRRLHGRVILLTAIICSLVGTSLLAQQIWLSGGFNRFNARYAKAEDFDGQWMYCRAFWGSGYDGTAPGGWTTDYPGADNNFSVRLAELTRVNVKFDEDRQPHFVVVRLNEPLLHRCPMLFMENVEGLRFRDSEVAG